MPTTAVDLKAEIDEVVRLLNEAKTDVNFLTNVQEELEKGTEEFGPDAIKNARRALIARLAEAHTRLSEVIASTSSL